MGKTCGCKQLRAVNTSLPLWGHAETYAAVWCYGGVALVHGGGIVWCLIGIFGMFVVGLCVVPPAGTMLYPTPCALCLHAYPRAHLRNACGEDGSRVHHRSFLPHRQPCTHRKHHANALHHKRFEPHDAWECIAVEKALHFRDAASQGCAFHTHARVSAETVEEVDAQHGKHRAQRPRAVCVDERVHVVKLPRGWRE